MDGDWKEEVEEIVGGRDGGELWLVCKMGGKTYLNKNLKNPSISLPPQHEHINK